MNTKRPVPLTIAIILLALFSLGSLSLPLFGHPPPRFSMGLSSWGFLAWLRHLASGGSNAGG